MGWHTWHTLRPELSTSHALSHPTPNQVFRAECHPSARVGRNRPSTSQAAAALHQTRALASSSLLYRRRPAGCRARRRSESASLLQPLQQRELPLPLPLSPWYVPFCSVAVRPLTRSLLCWLILADSPYASWNPRLGNHFWDQAREDVAEDRGARYHYLFPPGSFLLSSSQPQFNLRDEPQGAHTRAGTPRSEFTLGTSAQGLCGGQLGKQNYDAASGRTGAYLSF